MGGNRGFEDDREYRGAERAADLLDRPGEHARVADLLLIQPEEGDGHHGNGDRAEPEAADDQPEREQPHVGARSSAARERGEIDLDRVPAAVLSMPFDLMRHDLLMTLKPVPHERIVSIIDDLFLPLVSAYR
jgi:hypothetical protein